MLLTVITIVPWLVDRGSTMFWIPKLQLKCLKIIYLVGPNHSWAIVVRLTPVIKKTFQKFYHFDVSTVEVSHFGCLTFAPAPHFSSSPTFTPSTFPVRCGKHLKCETSTVLVFHGLYIITAYETYYFNINKYKYSRITLTACDKIMTRINRILFNNK